MTIKPMLAVDAGDVEKLTYPLFASPKLDGIRALIIDGVVMSRSFKPIPNEYVQKLFGRPELNGLDGELIVGSPKDPDAFNNTTGAIRRKEGEPDVTFYVFDCFNNPDKPFDERYLEAMHIASGERHICMVTSQSLVTADQLKEYTQLVTDRGYEGAMTRLPSGKYKSGRSTLKQEWLLKVKHFADAEATVIGFTEQMHNANEAKKNALGRTERSTNKENMVPKGTLGTLVVREHGTGVEFEIGTGFSDAQRKVIWENQGDWLNTVIKFKHQPHGRVIKPRCPVFLGERAEFDMDVTA